jgi:CheY-like chemotaxis protein
MAVQANVLVIDDDVDFVASIRAILESKGHTVTHADCGKEGLRKLAEIKPNVILLDVMMEDESAGYGVNQAIKYQGAYQAFRNIPIIMLSSIQESPDELYGRASEVDMIRPDLYLTKPVDPVRLIEVVERAAARAGSDAMA